jgi:DNA polymerase elongation subunit (family B)
MYTNVYQYGSKMLVRGYDTKGNQYKRKEDFQPTIFVPSKTPTDYKTLQGNYVASLHPGTMRDTKDYIDRYKDVEGFEIYGNNNYVAQYISDNFKGELKFDIENIRIWTIDIETSTESGFPNMKTANEEILLITLQDNATKRVITFGSKPYVNTDKNVQYRYCTNELDLLREFINYWSLNTPDVVTGWNCNLFDIPYLIRRINATLGETYSKRLSPWESIRERTINIRGNEETAYDIHGVAVLDYLDLYKKYTYTTQESYRLDHIAFVELGERKRENPGNSFKEFYTDYWKEFVEYNIHDVALVDRLEDKMKLIELQITMAYNAKINYEDVFSQVRMWDAIIYNHLRDKGIAIPQNNSSRKDSQFEGAYVKDPIVGMHKWVASFDLNSLYPHLIMQYNISPETLLAGKMNVTVDQLLNKEINTTMLKEQNITLTANGVSYTKDTQGFMPALMEEMYKNRSRFKKQMLKIQQEFEHDKKNNDLRKEISRLNNLQMAMKIALNSAYGAMGNQYFRYFDIRMAEGITTSGQLSIRWMANKLNAFMNKTLKTNGKDYVIAIDTDSIYLTLEDLVETTCVGKDTNQKIAFMDKICEDVFQPFIDKGYDELAEYMNSYDQKMQMKREVLADKGLWTAKKRYILNVHNSEGVQYATPKLKVMGLEMVKSSTPQIIRNKLKESITVILDGDQSALHKFITTFRKEFNQLPVEQISFPRSVNNLQQYTSSSNIYGSGTPMHVRGALLYNHYLKKAKLEGKYPLIREGEKIKFVYLKTPNTIQENIISFTNELPKELGLHKYVNYDIQFEKVFLDALQIVIQPLGWSVEEKSSLEDFFG